MLELSKHVERDLEEIADWIAQDSPNRAIRFIREIREEFDKIEKRPLLFQLLPDIGEDARLSVVKRYVILFRIAGKVTRIERVVFGGRDLPEIL